MAKEEMITIDQAITLLNEVHGHDPEEYGRNIYSKKTIYNAICKKLIRREGPVHMAKISKRDLLNQFGPKRKSA